MSMRPSRSSSTCSARVGLGRKTLFGEQFGTDLDARNDDFAFVGDSPNDAPMFAYFARSIGVANIARFAGLLTVAPKYVTRNACGAGFAEVVAYALDSQ
jgi:hydroxymethylpyrimidine pyrophosphatase-like HAD family hydrolase